MIVLLCLTQWPSDWNTHLEMENLGTAPIVAEGSSKQTSSVFLIRTMTNKVIGKEGLPGLSNTSKGIWHVNLGFLNLFSISAPI